MKPYTSRLRLAGGYSLIETIIVLAIVGLMMAAMLQAMLGIRQYASTAEVQDDLNLEAQRILAVIREDLGASGWYLPVGQPNPLSDRTDLFFPYVQVQQTGKLGTRFPHHDRLAYTAKDWVTVQRYPGLPGSASDWDATTLDEAKYRTSFYARSQELIFLKIMKGSFDPNGTMTIIEPIDFSDRNGATYASAGNHALLGIRGMSQWNRGTEWEDYHPVTGRPTGRYYLPAASARIYDADASGIWLRPAVTGGSSTAMPLRWETMTRYPNLVAVTDPISGVSSNVLDLREVREYSYAVVPNPSAGNRGQLVRAYKKPLNEISDSESNKTAAAATTDWIISTGNYAPDAAVAAMPSAMVVDKVLSDKVDRITFDTFRTDRRRNPNYPGTSPDEFMSGLEINQIRVRLFLSKKAAVDIGASQHLMVEATFSMRSTSDSNAINDLQQRVGNGGSVIIH